MAERSPYPAASASNSADGEVRAGCLTRAERWPRAAPKPVCE